MLSSCHRLQLLVALCTVPFAFAGCGSSENRLKTAEVTGTVTYKGEPLHIGSVVMIPDGGGPAAEANITREGTFSMGPMTRRMAPSPESTR